MIVPSAIARSRIKSDRLQQYRISISLRVIIPESKIVWLHYAIA
ncbi:MULTISPECIES: hypothetical protein [unclassified Microcoleus]